MPANTMLIVAMRQRPASCERTSRVTRSSDVPVNRRDWAGPAPRVLPSSTPLTDSPSSDPRGQAGGGGPPAGGVRLPVGGDPPAHAGAPPGQPDGRRQDDQRQQGQPPAQGGHGDRGADDG